MLLLTGPPGSGKTYRLLEKVRDCARRGAADVRLIVPTATFAEHLRNELAREGLLVRPVTIQTLFQFVDSLADPPPQVPVPVFRQLVRASLAELNPPEFRAVSSLPGLQRAVADLIEELDATAMYTGTGKTVSNVARVQLGLSPYFEPVLAIAARVREKVEHREMEMRSDRFRRTARQIRSCGLHGVREVLFDGFFRFTRIELELIRALSESVDVTVTLPAGSSAIRTRDAMLAIGFDEEICSHSQTRPKRSLFEAPSPEREAEEIARRILENATRGRPFREIGVVLRSREPYVPILRRAFERFGIPARFYFAESLSAQPVVRRITAVIEALLGGWDHEDLLDAVRLYPASPEFDLLAYRLIEGLPDNGLPAFGSDDRFRTVEDTTPLGGRPPGLRPAPPPAFRFLEQLSAIDSWRTDKLRPSAWAQRLSELTALFPSPNAADAATHDQALLLRANTSALNAFCRSLESAAESIDDDNTVPLADYWQEVTSLIAAADLRVEDNRRNVVHVMDAYEARQWRLPVVFVCGLNERLFPVHHAENALLGDAARETLRSAGIDLITSRDHDDGERFLFEVATTRATENLTLSYAAFDHSGDQMLPSLCLGRLLLEGEIPLSPVIPLRPRPRRTRAIGPRPTIRENNLLEDIAAKHVRLSASSMERFLQCPFAFFSEKTLRLGEPPVPPNERLNSQLEGDIVHAVLAELYARPNRFAEWERIFEHEFETRCRNARVPPGYRKQTSKLEMRSSLARFVAQSDALTRGKAETEVEFEFPLTEDVFVRGRIDRIHPETSGGPIVIDYKYSQTYKLRDYMRGNEEGQLVQAGLYLAAVRALRGVFPGGMLFCTVRNGLGWSGWHTLAEWESLTPMRTEASIAQLIDIALATSRETAVRIRSGETDAAPADETKCSYCANRDICRVETAPIVQVAGGDSR